MKRRRERITVVIKNILVPVAVFALLLVGLVGGLNYFNAINETQSLELLEQSVHRATIQCYAAEGIYPADLTYLEENYGVVYDKEKYGVEYGCYASNIMPTIIVYEK